MPEYSLMAYLEDKDEAASALALHLRRGELSLVLGAGVSKGLGLPNWSELVGRIEDAAGVTPEDSAGDSMTLMKRMDAVRDTVTDEQFLELVHGGLYQDLSEDGVYPESLLTQRMMIALGALVMSSQRGSVTDVFTLNFDDVLDWYLHLHGMRTQVVESLPVLLRGDVDVRIHHFHGFVPLMPTFSRSDWLVLTYDQLIDRLSETTSPWATFMGAEFLSKYVLFVGSSMSDTDVDVMLKAAAKIVDGDRPLGFAIGVGFSEPRKSALRRAGIIPISLTEYSEIPQFLLTVCQLAAEDSR